MKECLWCKKEYEPKKDTSKFCSTSCRVMWNKKYGKKKKEVGLSELQELYNSILTAVNSINAKNGQPEALAAVVVPKVNNEPKIRLRRPFLTLQALINECESMEEYEPLRKEIEEADHLTTREKAILLRKR